MFEEITKKITEAKIIPVVKIDNVELAVPLANALISGGINAIEITFRTTEGENGYKKIEECISCLSKNVPSMLVGAGTVTSPELAERAHKAGAKFLMAPGYNEKTVDYCIKNNIALYPGVCNASQIENAMAQGLSVLKFFPAQLSGGVPMLKALEAPFPTIKFIPTGGINSQNAASFLATSNVIAIGGSWMVKEDFIKNKDWNTIRELSKQAVSCLSANESKRLRRIAENKRVASSVGNTSMTEEEKMLQGLIYDPTDSTLSKKREVCHALCQDYNASRDSEIELRSSIIEKILGELPQNITFQGPIQFDYGCNIKFGKNCYANFNFTVLDSCPIVIGDSCFFGPNCSIVTPVHPFIAKERNLRKKDDGSVFDYEYARPINIGSNCWFASNVTVCGGVSIGEGCVIAAGSVVTSDIPANSLAGGVPCKVIRKLDDSDIMGI